MITPFDIPDRILVAIGGNAIHPEDIEGTSREQKIIAANTARALLPLALLDNELVVTHGNGPVVGKILMRQALTREPIWRLAVTVDDDDLMTPDAAAELLDRSIPYVTKRGFIANRPAGRPISHCCLCLGKMASTVASV